MRQSVSSSEVWTTADEINFINRHLIPICLELNHTRFIDRYMTSALVRGWDKSVNVQQVLLAAQDARRMVKFRIDMNISNAGVLVGAVSMERGIEDLLHRCKLAAA